MPEIDGNGGLKFENGALAYQAAADRLGVVVAVQAFVKEDLAAKKLMAPFDRVVPTPGAYFLAHRLDAPIPRRVDAFVSWIEREAAA